VCRGWPGAGRHILGYCPGQLDGDRMRRMPVDSAGQRRVMGRIVGGQDIGGLAIEQRVGDVDSAATIGMDDQGGRKRAGAMKIVVLA